MPSARVTRAIRLLSQSSVDLDALKGLTAGELNEVLADVPRLRTNDAVQQLYSQRRSEEAERRAVRTFLVRVWTALLALIGVALAGVKAWTQLRP